MADSKISALPAATTPLTGSEVLPIVQSTTTKQVSVSDLTAGRAFDALGMTLTSTDAGATAAPLLDLYRNSASPAVSDTLGEIEFNGKDSANNKQQYGLIHASILSPTSGAEQGQLHFETATGGASTEKMIIGTTNLVINEIGAVFNVRVEGDTDANLLVTDATNDRVGVGVAAPLSKFHVQGANDNNTMRLSLSAAGSTTLRLDTWAGNANDRNWAFRNRYNLSGRLELMVGTTNVDDPLTTAMYWNNDSTIAMPAYGAGAATFSASGVISSVSDETWKVKDGVPTNTDEMLQKLEPGYWFYNEEKAPIFGEDRQLGFYAQNVREAIGAEAAPTPEEGKPWGYYDRSVLAVVVMSLQKALTTIENQQTLITQLQADVNELKGA